jgi:hypothetical protein
VTLIEHDNTQNGVWRDLAADFGHDALAEHYRRQPHESPDQISLLPRRPAVSSHRQCN